MYFSLDASSFDRLGHYTVKLLIEAPGFYWNKLLLPPACIRDPAYIGDPASIKTLSTWHTRVINFFYI